MDYYTNELSLKAMFGDAEVTGLLSDSPGSEQNARLEKAAKTSFDEINGYLKGGGYVVPPPFTPFGAAIDPLADPAPPPYMNGKVQSVSDAFTAYYLASAVDLNKKRYEDMRAEGLKWLEGIRDGLIPLLLTETDTITGFGEAVTITRPRVFDRSQMREADIFPPRVRNFF